MLVPLRKAIALTGLSANTLRKYADNGTIRAERIGERRQRLFDGKIIDNLGSKEWFNYDDVTVNRDINAARNILIRALRDSSAMAEMPLLSNTIAAVW